MTMPLKEFLEAADYKISEVQSYKWHCYGYDAQVINCYFGQASAYAVFCGKDQTVFEVTVVSGDERNFAYRWIHPDFVTKYNTEAEVRNVDPKQCFGDVKWADTESFEDILTKVSAIRKGEEFDTRVVVSFDLDEDTIKLLERAAETMGTTVDDFIGCILKKVVDEASATDSDS